MSRLYYPTPAIEPGLKAGKDTLGDVSEKVVKLIPSEIIAGYIFLIGLVPLIATESLRPWISLGIFLLCLVLTPLYLNRLAEKDKPKPNIHLIVSTLAFIIWAYSVSGGTTIPQYYDPAIASIILGVFTLVTGVIPLE